MSKKLMLPWEGPYLVVTVLSDVTYRIQKTARSKLKVVHSDRLKPYEGPELEAWSNEALVPVEARERIESEEAQVTNPVQSGAGDDCGNESEKNVTERSEGREANPPKQKSATVSPQKEAENEKHERRTNVVVPRPEPPLGRRNPARDRRRPSRYDL